MPKLGRKQPCTYCPWRRTSERSWLGDDNPVSFFRSSITREGDMPCHMQIDYSLPDWKETQLPRVDYCAGMLIFFKNWLKMPRRPSLLEAVRAVLPSKYVFSTPKEFLDHHMLDGPASKTAVEAALWPYSGEDEDGDGEHDSTGSGRAGGSGVPEERLPELGA